MPIRLGLIELIMVFACLVVLVVMVVGVAVLILRRGRVASEAKGRRDDDMSLVMSVQEIATLLRTDVNAVEKLIRDGRLPALRVGEDWRISRANVIAFLNAGERADEKDP